MRFVAGPKGFFVKGIGQATAIRLYSNDGASHHAGAALSAHLTRMRLAAAPRAWDLMSIALAVVTADQAVTRSTSSDGWTREFEMHIAVDDPAFWQSNADGLQTALNYLTTDRWSLAFHARSAYTVPQRAFPIEGDTVALLSGGLDSLVGAIDLASTEAQPVYVSHTVRGDAAKQRRYSARIAPGRPHIQTAHAASTPKPRETSQRSRSLVFIALGVLSATGLSAYRDGGAVQLVLPENGFIAINPSLTLARVGSLSTRTAHPTVLGGLQQLLDSADLRVEIINPYRHSTKGEMMARSADRTLLEQFASDSTSCGRFQRFNYTHCGRCVPCQVRRSAFIAAGMTDSTKYVFKNLGTRDEDHALFADVRDVGMAIKRKESVGIERWTGAALASEFVSDAAPYIDMLDRGLTELAVLHSDYSVT